MKRSAWCEENLRVERGPMKGERLRFEAWQRDLIDLADVPGLAQLDVEKSNQIGVSLILEAYIASCAALDGDPMGVGYPNWELGKRIFHDRLKPMFRKTDALRALDTGVKADFTRQRISLANGFLAYLMTSGSKASMESDSYRRAVNDEVDLFDLALDAIRKRLTAYEGRELEWNVSKPTTADGVIHELIFGRKDERGVERGGCHAVLHWFVPCPHCGGYQRITLASLRYDERLKAIESRRDRASEVLRTNAVWMDCAQCGKRIAPTEHRAMVERGRWSTDSGGLADAAGEIHANAIDVKRLPRATRLGVKIWKAYSTWMIDRRDPTGRATLTWASILAEQIEATGDREAMYIFRTGTCGEPWEDELERIAKDVYDAKSRRARLDEGICPWWTARLVMTVDTQHRHFKVVIRAVGGGKLSARVWHGRVDTFAELDELLDARWWPVEVKSDPLEEGTPKAIAGYLQVACCFIDSGGTRLGDEEISRTSEVYDWALGHAEKVRVIKGDSHPRPGVFIRRGTAHLKRSEGEGEKEFPLLLLNTSAFTDELFWRVKLGAPQLKAKRAIAADDPPAEEVDADGACHGEAERSREIWHLNRRNDPDYNHQMSSVRKVPGKPFPRYIPAQSGAVIDFLDCEVYQCAAGYHFELDRLPPPDEVEKLRAEERAAEAARAAAAKTPDADKPENPPRRPEDLLGEDPSRFL